MVVERRAFRKDKVRHFFLAATLTCRLVVGRKTSAGKPSRTPALRTQRSPSLRVSAYLSIYLSIDLSVSSKKKILSRLVCGITGMYPYINRNHLAHNTPRSTHDPFPPLAPPPPPPPSLYKPCSYLSHYVSVVVKLERIRTRPVTASPLPQSWNVFILGRYRIPPPPSVSEGVRGQWPNNQGKRNNK